MKGPDPERQTLDSDDATAAEPMTVGALVHQVLNATAAIRFSVSALRAGGASEPQLADLARIEEAAAMVGRSLKTFASTAELVPVAPAGEQPVDLYVVCCELAERLRVTEGRPVYCRAFGDCRGPWDRHQLAAFLSALVDLVVGRLPPEGMLNVAVSGLGRHVRLDLHGLGSMSLEGQQDILGKASRISSPRGAMLTMRVSPSAGTSLSLRLPR